MLITLCRDWTTPSKGSYVRQCFNVPLSDEFLYKEIPSKETNALVLEYKDHQDLQG